MMRTLLLRSMLTALALAAGALHADRADAVTRYTRNNATWSTSSNWTTNPNCNANTGGGVPAAGDDVVICANDTITLDISTAALNSLTIRATGVLNVGSSATARTVNTVSFSNAGTFTFNTNGAHSLTVTGAADNSGTFQVNNGAVTSATPTVTITGLLTNSGTFQFAGGAALTWSANGGITNSGTINVNTASNVNHTLQVQGAFSNSNVVNCQPDANSLCTLVFNGGTQTLGGGGAWTIYQLTLNNAAGLTLTQTVTVNNLLTLTNGILSTGGNFLNMAAGATVSRTASQTSSFVAGLFTKTIAAGSPTVTWEVGSAASYGPVSIAFNTVTVAGLFSVISPAALGDHPNLGSSNLDATKSVNRYWTVINGLGTNFTSAVMTLNWQPGAVPADDRDAGATFANFAIGRYNGSNWYYPDQGTVTASSAQATSLQSTNPGLTPQFDLPNATAVDFAVAEVSQPTPYSYWKMQQSAWNGTVGEVLDSGAGNKPGTSAATTTKPSTSNTSPRAIDTDPGTCRYGVFPFAAGSNRSYVGVPNFPNLGTAAATNGFTVSAWVRSTNVSLGGQRVFIDDEGATGGWGLSLFEGTPGRARFYERGSATVIVDSLGGAAMVANTWYFVATVVSLSGTAPNALLKGSVYVFNQSGTLIAWDSGSFTGFTFGADNGLASIGGETAVSSEDLGFNGNIDELRVHDVPLSQQHLKALSLASYPCATHYAITASVSGATCDPRAVTITSHDSTHSGLAPTAGTLLTLTTSTGSGVWTTKTAGSGTFTSSGSNNGQATYLWPGGEFSATFNLRQNVVTPVLSVNLIDSAGTVENGAEDPLLAFAAAGFRISDGANAVRTVGTQISGKRSDIGFGGQSLFLQAIRTDTNTGACVALFPNPSEVDIEVGATCNNPSACAQNASLTTTSTTGTPTGSFVPNSAYPSVIRFRFTTASAEAPFFFSYADAGQIALQFRYQQPSPPAGTYVSGSSNTFVARPFGFRISGPAASASPSPAVAVLVAAGVNFNTTLTAVQWKTGDDVDNDGIPDNDAQISGNAATPNFGQESVPATATLSQTLNAPAGGASGSLTGTAYSGFSAGAKTNPVSWSEVGFINLFATTTNYLASGQNISNSTTGLTGVGRFRPDRFVVTNRGTLTAACSAVTPFTYMNQGMSIANIQIEARNANNVATTNYRGAYALFNPATFSGYGVSGRALDGAGIDLTGRIDPASTASGSWGASSGVLTAALNPIAVTRASPDAPDRFTQARLGILPVDPDGVTINAANLDLDVDNNGSSDHTQLIGAAAAGNVDLRFGRLRVDNAVGSEKLALPVGIRTEYWAGTGFTLNTDDSCTTIPRSVISLDFTPASNLAACETAITTANVTFTGGIGSLTLAAPGSGNNGTLLLTPQLGASPVGSYCPSVGGAYTLTGGAGTSWLFGRWNDAANPDANANTFYDDKPASRVAFGLYGSQPNNYIYFRENY